MQHFVETAKAIAQESAMEKRLGCVIVHRRRVIAHSSNYTVGTRLVGREMYNVSMHSEMGAIEQLAKRMGFLQSLHRVLSGHKSHVRLPKVYFEGRSGRCKGL